MRVLAVEQPDGLAGVAALPELGAPRPVVVVVGGAAGLDDATAAGLESLAAAIVRAAAAAGAALVDGGTDSGIMRLIGRAHAAASAGVPLVGVVVRELAAKGRLEPNHTHAVLVPGSRWGDEASWLAGLATRLAAEEPSITVLVNGGEIAWTDVAESVRAGRPVLAVAGTGRTADALVAALADDPHDERAAALAATGLVLAVGGGTSLASLVERRIGRALMAPGSADAG